MVKKLEYIIGRVISDAVRVDGNAHPDELERAKQLLLNDWKAFEFHGQVMDINAWDSFQDQFKEEIDTQKTFAELEDFIQEYKADLPANFGNDLAEACYKIASATSKRNKSELVYLSKIRSITEG